MGTDLARPSEAAFRSGRLVFKTFENTESNKASFFAITDDPITQALADPSPFQPKTTHSSDELFTRLQNSSFIAVFICLLNGSDNHGEAEGDRNLSSFEAEAQAIGFMRASKPSYDAILGQREATLSIAIKQGYQRRGYGLKAHSWLLDWIFNYSAVHCVRASVIEYNTGSIALY
jgi:RimJ/RimL family protein N-acetyltransferase